jgi:polyhydroxybutyrate depolymerase
VFPDGIGTEPGKLTWNAHFCCGAALRENSDDIGFIAALIDRIASETAVDRSRIYATGMSNGAMLAYQLAAARPDLFAAIAPVSGTIGGTTREGERFVIAPPDRPVPVMVIHGRKDPYVLFDGGSSTILGFPKRSNMAVADALDFWAKADGCNPSPETSEPEPGILRHVAFADCRAGSDVQLWELEQGEHSWPPATFPAPDGSMRSAAEEILAFFAAHRRG